MKRTRISLALMCLTTVFGPGGCFSAEGETSAGENCDRSVDCKQGLECVVVEGDQGVCLPSPTARSTRSCDADDECRLSTGELWPVESECLSGQCRCLTEEVECVDPDDDGGEDVLVLEEETCRCVVRGGQGDPCFTAQTCQNLLSCVAGECTPGTGEEGMACNISAECDVLCDRSAGLELGICT